MTQFVDIQQIGVTQPAAKEFAGFVAGIFGFPTSTTADGSMLYVRPDSYPYRTTVYEDARRGLKHVGLGGWGHRRLADSHPPVVFPPGKPVDIRDGDIQSAEFELE